MIATANYHSCRINLPNRCCHLISRVARRAFEFEGLQAANRKGRYDREKLLWQFTVAIKSDPVGTTVATGGDSATGKAYVEVDLETTAFKSTVAREVAEDTPRCD